MGILYDSGIPNRLSFDLFVSLLDNWFVRFGFVFNKLNVLILNHHSRTVLLRMWVWTGECVGVVVYLYTGV